MMEEWNDGKRGLSLSITHRSNIPIFHSVYIPFYINFGLFRQ